MVALLRAGEKAKVNSTKDLISVPNYKCQTPFDVAVGETVRGGRRERGGVRARAGSGVVAHPNAAPRYRSACLSARGAAGCR